VKDVELKEIIVITDGKANIGGDPSLAAKRAKENSIIVSAIGIIGEGEDEPVSEVQRIADMGGGQWELTYLRDLSKTLMMVTQKTVNRTLTTVVNRELKELIGAELEEMKPKARGKFIRYIEGLSDEISLKCCILLDCSGSMKSKLKTAKESILDLMESLKGRKGRSELALIAFPGEVGEKVKLICDFTNDIDSIKNSLMELRANGTTPTGRAILKAVDLFNGKYMDDEVVDDGLFGDNVV